MRNIIPYSDSADFLVNTSMPYELCLYQPKLLDHFAEWTQRYQGDALRLDAHTRASRIFDLLQTIRPCQEDQLVPKDSVIREFIGGLDLS
jgi:uridine kinase